MSIQDDAKELLAQQYIEVTKRSQRFQKFATWFLLPLAAAMFVGMFVAAYLIEVRGWGK